MQNKSMVNSFNKIDLNEHLFNQVVIASLKPLLTLTAPTSHCMIISSNITTQTAQVMIVTINMETSTIDCVKQIALYFVNKISTTCMLYYDLLAERYAVCGTEKQDRLFLKPCCILAPCLVWSTAEQAVA